MSGKYITDDGFFTPAGAARKLDIRPGWVYFLILIDVIPAKLIRRKIRIRPADLTDLYYARYFDRLRELEGPRFEDLYRGIPFGE